MTGSSSSTAAAASPRAASTTCSSQRIRLRSPDPDQLLRALRERGLDASPDGPGTVIVAGADPDTVGRAVRDSGAVLHEMSTQGALEALYVGLTEAS